MAFVLQMIWQCLGYTNADSMLEKESLVPEPAVRLSQHKSGGDAVIVKSGKRLCGTGGCLATSEIVQDKAYFEVKLQSAGVWGFGVAVPEEDLEKAPLGESTFSWVLQNSGKICHNKKCIHDTKLKIEEGDILGCSYDHVELNFYLNGKSLNQAVRGIKGSIFPAFYVDQNAILDVEFSNFSFPPPSGYQCLMVEKSII